MSDEVKVWERQPYDTLTSFQAFTRFYLPQDNPRSVAEAFRRYQSQNGIDSSATIRAPGQWQRWSRAWNDKDQRKPDSMTWSERAEKYDDFMSAKRLADLEKRRDALLEQEWVQSVSLFKLAQEIVSRGGDFITTKRRVIKAEYDKDGKQLTPEREIIVTSLNIAVAMRALEVGDKLARLSLGEPTETMGLQYKVYGATDEFDPEAA